MDAGGNAEHGSRLKVRTTSSLSTAPVGQAIIFPTENQTLISSFSSHFRPLQFFCAMIEAFGLPEQLHRSGVNGQMVGAQNQARTRPAGQLFLVSFITLLFRSAAWCHRPRVRATDRTDGQHAAGRQSSDFSASSTSSSARIVFSVHFVVVLMIGHRRCRHGNS